MTRQHSLRRHDDVVMMQRGGVCGERVVVVVQVDVLAVGVRDGGDVHGLVDRRLLREGGQLAPIDPS